MDIRIESPFPFESIPRLYRWIETFRDRVADDFAPNTLGEFVILMADRLESHKSWAIYRDEELGGLITFERLNPWLGTAHVLLKPEFQAKRTKGEQLAVKACRQAVTEMFQEGIGKLSFYPFAGNLAIGSLLINIGAKREGTLEAHTLSNGKPVDIWMYGLTKENFKGEHHARNAVERSGVDEGQFAKNHHHQQPVHKPGILNPEPVVTADILA